MGSLSYAQDAKTSLITRMREEQSANPGSTAPAPEPLPKDSTIPTVVSSAGAIASINSMDVLDDKRPLTIGDCVSYKVVQERVNQPLSLIVTDSGEMEVPLLGRVRAEGKTCKELAKNIKAELEKTYFLPGHATVIIGLNSVSARSRGQVYFSGQIRSQGPMDIPLDNKLTLSKAILKAGGFTDFANQRKVKILRKPGSGTGASTETIVDVAEIMKGKSNDDPVLQPDDLIIIPAKMIAF